MPVQALTLGVVATSRKPDERRQAIHPAHLGRIDADLRERMFFERGYGDELGSSDEEIEPLVGGLRSREELFAQCDVLLLPKPLAEDLETLRPGQVVWGWPHCVQDREITQLAIDRRVTLIAWEAMNHWTRDGRFSVHVFHKNNELAGYCSVLHAFSLLGTSGDYGRRLSAAVISFGATARGAVRGLAALGVSDVSVLTQRAVSAVAAPFASVRMRHFARDPGNPSRTLALEGPGPGPLVDVLAEHDIVVNCILQDTDAPLMFVMNEDLGRFRPGTLFIDVSCDEGMAFEWARPTSFADPMVDGGQGPALLRRRPQPVVPVELGDVGEQRGAARVPAHRDGRRRRVGRRRDDPPRDRDPRGHRREPAHPVLPGARGDLPVRSQRSLTRPPPTSSTRSAIRSRK